MRKPEIIECGEKEIIYLDFTNLRKSQDILQLGNDGAALIRSQGYNQALTLTNMEGMYFNNEIRNNYAEVVKGNSSFVKASAVIGLKGLIAIMYNGFVTLTGRNIKLFKTKEEAIKYLISVE